MVSSTTIINKSDVGPEEQIILQHKQSQKLAAEIAQNMESQQPLNISHSMHAKLDPTHALPSDYIEVAEKDNHKFKLARDSGFARRNRNMIFDETPFSLVPNSVRIEKTRVIADITNSVTKVLFEMTLIALSGGMARVQIREKYPLKPRYEVKDVVLPDVHEIPLEKVTSASATKYISGEKTTTFKFERGTVIITHSPFRLDFLIDKDIVLTVNGRGLMNFEHTRAKLSSESAELGSGSGTGSGGVALEEELNGMWEETFRNHIDTKPNGPTSVGMDFSFHGARYVYGIPERPTDMVLKATRREKAPLKSIIQKLAHSESDNGGGNNKLTTSPSTGSYVALEREDSRVQITPEERDREPYRMFNLDVFEYGKVGNHMGLYGSIPLLLAHASRTTISGSSSSSTSAGSNFFSQRASSSASSSISSPTTVTSAIFWLNASDTWVDVIARPNEPTPHLQRSGPHQQIPSASSSAFTPSSVQSFNYDPEAIAQAATTEFATSTDPSTSSTSTSTSTSSAGATTTTTTTNTTSTTTTTAPQAPQRKSSFRSFTSSPLSYSKGMLEKLRSIFHTIVSSTPEEEEQEEQEEQEAREGERGSSGQEKKIRSGKTSSTGANSDFPGQSHGLNENEMTTTHWFSESGIIDFFVLLGPSPNEVFRQYSTLTGTTPLPPRFSLGYHQCRWNYEDDLDVRSVDGGFDTHGIPYDVMWLDIEHTDGKRYFTWDKTKFPDPAALQNDLAAKGRKMVTIIDPHILRDDQWEFHQLATQKQLYIKDKTGKADYIGECWPGSSSWLDFGNPEVREFWANHFAHNKYDGSTPNLFTWNDMNEPAVFHGPELTMHLDAIDTSGFEHRDSHNLYGFYQHMASYEGQKRRCNNTERTFILSRSFYAGSQRFGPIWTGDNKADWEYLEVATKMLLSLAICGMPFSGADVGGFSKNPTPELLVRWYQAGAFQPFFRGHSALDTARREPWLFGPETTALIKKAILERYTYLPFWYTLFRETSLKGCPVIRPLWVEYPENPITFTMDDQFLVGRDLLVKPVSKPFLAQSTLPMYFPGSEPWYDCYTLKRVMNNSESSTSTSTSTSVAAEQMMGFSKNLLLDMETIPVFQRGGSIIPRKMVVRESTEKMKNDPYTLFAALDKSGNAQGVLYTDDGFSLSYLNGAFISRLFRITSTLNVHGSAVPSYTTGFPSSVSNSAPSSSLGSSTNEPLTTTTTTTTPPTVTTATTATTTTIPTYSSLFITSQCESTSPEFFSSPENISRIVILGVDCCPASATFKCLSSSSTALPEPIKMDYNRASGVLDLQELNVNVGKDFEIVVNF